MPSPAPAGLVDLSGGLEPALARVPATAGVGQLLGPEGRHLLLGPASDLRRWAGSHLGLGPRRPGKRPRTNLAGLATAIGWVETVGPFHQRLTYERLMAPLVPLSARRDLRPPAFLLLDAGQRFPRVVVAGELDAADLSSAFGPFRDRRAAEKARDAVHRRFRLRPCDWRFEPDPALALGLGCLHAQVHSCAAPCLARVGEEQYRALAAEAAAWLADPAQRADAPDAVPATVSAAGSSRALVVDPGRKGRLGLFPVAGGRVLDACARFTTADAVLSALATLEWSAPPAAQPSDWSWLTGWLRGAKARASYLAVGPGPDPAALAARVAALLAAAAASPAPPTSATGSVIR